MKITCRILLCAVLLAASMPALAQEKFGSAEDAVAALVNAAKAGDRKVLLKILGPAGKDVVQSGDEVADRETRERFVAAYDAKHSLAQKDGKTILVLGPEDWPFPIPMLNREGKWLFDTKEGKDEIIRRRIGRNELAAIEVSRAYVDAQRDYASLDPEQLGQHVYAQRIVSSPGKKDGLYWPTSEGEALSPLGELAAQASAEGYKVGQTPIPYHGYYYRVLNRQGASAEGGAYDYVVGGKMIGGFALVAYPAVYGNSGVMTFMVNHAGDVFQKDLGPKTVAAARKISAFAPDKTWNKVSPSD